VVTPVVDPLTGLTALVDRLLAVLLPWGVLVLEAASVLMLILRAVIGRFRQRRWRAGARLVTVLAPPQPDPDGAAALWGNLAGLLRPRWRRVLCGQPHLCFEYHLTPHAATIRIWVPGPIPPGLVERAVTAAWPGATTRTTPTTPTLTPAAPTALPSGSPRPARRVVTGGVLRLARSTGLPLDDNPPGDPITALLAVGADLTNPPTPGRTGPSPGPAAEEEIVVQILARPVPTRASTGHAGLGHGLATTVLDVVTATLLGAVRECLALATPTHPATARSHATARALGHGLRPYLADPRERLERTSGDRAAVAKARHATFDTLVRYAATTTFHTITFHTATFHTATLDTASITPTRAPRAAARRRVRGRAHAVAAVFASFTGHNHYRRHRLLLPARAIAARRFRHGDRLSITELAAIATLPTGYTPALTRAGARSVPPPPAIPAPGPQAKPLGDTTTSGGGSGSGRPVGVRVADARHHLHVIGATGSGKSTLLTQLILDDIRHRRGIVVIDPKGDLITDITTRLSPSVLSRAVLIDPDRPGATPNLNPLTTPAGAGGGAGGAGVMTRALAVENLVAICRRVFAGYWGPRTDDLMRAACLTLTAQPTPRTLADLPDLLTNPDTRARALRAVSDPVLRGFWTGYQRLSEPARAVVIAPLMNRIRTLLLRPYARALLTGHTPGTSPAPPGTNRPMIDVGRVLDGGLLLARLPKGSLGDDATRLIGSIIVAHTWTAATTRTHLPQDQRRDAALVIDECHNFLNLPYPIDDLLAEARGLRLSLTLAHQNLAQLPTELRAGITANARNKIIFTVGADDARDLARHTQPQLDDYDLAHLDAFHAAARLVDQHALTPAFTLRTRPLPPPRRT
jgi:hypothetical protein